MRKCVAAFDNDCVITKCDMLQFISEKIGKKKEGDYWEHNYHKLMFKANTEEKREKAAEQGLKGKYAPVFGLNLERLREIVKTIPLTAKAKKSLDLLHKEGCKIVVVSGTLLPIAQIVADVNSLPIDYFICSECEVMDGKIGKTTFILTPKRKGEKLATLLREWCIPPHQCFAIGDSISEKHMFELVGKPRSIGFNCREGLASEVGHVAYPHSDPARELMSVAKLILNEIRQNLKYQK